MDKNTFTQEDIFNKWLCTLRENQSVRYLHSERMGFLEDFVLMLKEHEVDYEDAKAFKKEVVLALTTEEGRKGKGKYKGWVKTVEQDFLSALANAYIEDPEKPVDKSEAVQSGNYMPKNRFITAWGLHKYGEIWSEFMDREAHKINSRLNIRFQEEVIFADFADDFEKFPNWLKNAFNS